jgi:hypothetical protein
MMRPTRWSGWWSTSLVVKYQNLCSKNKDKAELRNTLNMYNCCIKYGAIIVILYVYNIKIKLNFTCLLYNVIYKSFKEVDVFFVEKYIPLLFYLSQKYILDIFIDFIFILLHLVSEWKKNLDIRKNALANSNYI